MERPDLNNLPDDVQDYIAFLEEELLRLQSRSTASRPSAAPEAAEPEPAEPPTTMQVISISAEGLAKRTPRHLYDRQRRGGMGVFDIDLPDHDAPAHLVLADVAAHLLFVTDQGRAFRLPVATVRETAVRDRGADITSHFQLRPHERFTAVLPADGGKQLAIVSVKGWVRLIPQARLGPGLIPGMSFFDTANWGSAVAACWTSGSDDLFIATQQGQAIRFTERQVHKNGNLGIRLDVGDKVVAVTAVSEAGSVFLLGADGKGTLREMNTFRANKTLGAGGKAALKTEALVAAVAVEEPNDLFLISQTSKIIRFPASDVPPKSGAVQGVNCMNLRNDVVTATAVAILP